MRGRAVTLIDSTGARVSRPGRFGHEHFRGREVATAVRQSGILALYVAARGGRTALVLWTGAGRCGGRCSPKLATVARTAAGPRQLGQLVLRASSSSASPGDLSRARSRARAGDRRGSGRASGISARRAARRPHGDRGDRRSRSSFSVVRAAGIAKRRLAGEGGDDRTSARHGCSAPLRGLATAREELRPRAHAWIPRGSRPPVTTSSLRRRWRRSPARARSSSATRSGTLVAKAVSFGERSVRHVLTPRRDIVAVPIDITAPDVTRVMRESGCSRLPVYSGEKEDIVGFLYVKDVLGDRNRTGEGIAPLRPPTIVVQAEKPVGELLARVSCPQGAHRPRARRVRKPGRPRDHGGPAGRALR